MKWTMDAINSVIEFSVKHMMISTVKGFFEKATGDLEFDTANPETASIEVVIDVTSLNTHDKNRDGHVLSPDFLDVAQYPTITFKSTGVEKVGDSDYKVTGDLTLRGVTRQVVLDAEFGGQVKSALGDFRCGFSANTTISRKDFGLVWNMALEAGGVAVSDKVKINLEVELVQQQVESLVNA